MIIMGKEENVIRRDLHCASRIRVLFYFFSCTREQNCILHYYFLNLHFFYKYLYSIKNKGKISISPLATSQVQLGLVTAINPWCWDGVVSRTLPISPWEFGDDLDGRANSVNWISVFTSTEQGPRLPFSTTLNSSSMRLQVSKIPRGPSRNLSVKNTMASPHVFRGLLASHIEISWVDADGTEEGICPGRTVWKSSWREGSAWEGTEFCGWFRSPLKTYLTLRLCSKEC